MPVSMSCETPLANQMVRLISRLAVAIALAVGHFDRIYRGFRSSGLGKLIDL